MTVTSSGRSAVGPPAFQALRCPHSSVTVRRRRRISACASSRTSRASASWSPQCRQARSCQGSWSPPSLPSSKRELRGRCRGQLAQPRCDQRGLAVAGQAGHADPGQAAQRQVPVGAEVVAADVEHVRVVRGVGAGRAPLRAERLGERIGAQRADDEAAGLHLGDADADGPPVVRDVRRLASRPLCGRCAARSSRCTASRSR